MPKNVLPRAMVWGGVADDPVYVDAANPVPVGGAALDLLDADLDTVNANLGTLIAQGNAPLAGLPAGEAHIGQVGGSTVRISANFTRPADTAAYASGDLVANSTTAGSVAALTFANIGRIAGAGGMIRRARLRKSGTGITNASFRLHLYSAAPATIANGDNGAWLTDGVANYMGSLDITCDRAFSDGAAGIGIPTAGSEINFTSQTVYGLLEARGAYTPISTESFDINLEVIQN
jgi:hypothetical protein